MLKKRTNSGGQQGNVSAAFIMHQLDLEKEQQGGKSQFLSALLLPSLHKA